MVVFTAAGGDGVGNECVSMGVEKADAVVVVYAVGGDGVGGECVIGR